MPQLRLLHISLCLTAIAILGALAALRTLGPAGSVPLPVFAQYAMLAFAGVGILSAATLRTMIPPVQGLDEASWLTANRARCLLVWATLEGGVTLCGIAIFLGANLYAAGILAAGGLGYLVSLSPGTLAGH